MSDEYSDLAKSGWSAAGDPPMVWDGRGDAIVDILPDGRPYFESDMAAFIVQVVNGSAALQAEHVALRRDLADAHAAGAAEERARIVAVIEKHISMHHGNARLAREGGFERDAVYHDDRGNAVALLLQRVRQ